MIEGPASGAWADALAAAALVAVDPVGLGGLSVRAPFGPARDRLIATLTALLPAGTPVRRVPVGIGDDRLLGGLDLTATLAAGRPVAARGLLADADGGLVLVAMAERLGATVAAHLCAALDWQETRLERDGLAARSPARIGVVALDEGATPEERSPPALLERLAFHVSLESVGIQDLAVGDHDPSAILAARELLGRVRVPRAALEALAATALALGVASLRALVLAARAARASAALAGRRTVQESDAMLAARLVLAPRATRRPATAEDPGVEAPEPGLPEEAASTAEAGPAPEAEATPEPGERTEARPDVVLAAAAAAIPAGLLAALRHGTEERSRALAVGRAGLWRAGGLRGRPAGVRRGVPGPRQRLSLLETLRAAAPWQRLRRASRDPQATERGRIEVRRDDFHVRRFRSRAETTTIFIVDASGSAAMHRLAEAKGAVELLLADCYVRRDRVALIAFRGRGAELLLPPTRSLVRAKRGLAALPGGGGTPLAAGVDLGIALAAGVTRRGGTATLVVLTDGSANVARDGTPGRARAEADALAAARSAGAAGVAVLFVDTSPRPQPLGARLAVAMRARYLPLPRADAATLSRAARDAVPARR